MGGKFASPAYTGTWFCDSALVNIKVNLIATLSIFAILMYYA